MRLLTILMLLLATRMDAFAEGRKVALLVGVSTYQNKNIPPLRFAVKDVRDVGDSLVRHAGFERRSVFALTSESTGADVATSTNVLDRLDKLSHEITSEDTFFFYFSGHGFSASGKNFLATVNCDPTSLANLKRTAVPVEELRAKLNKIRAKQCIFLFDACRNRPKSKSAEDDKLAALLAKDLKLTASEAQVPVVFLMSCKEGQRSYEYESQQQGAFTHYLLEGMRGRALDPAGRLTMNGIGQYVQAKMRDWSAKYLVAESQIPDFMQFNGAATIVLSDKGAAGITSAKEEFFEDEPSGKRNEQGFVTKINPKDEAEMIWVPAGAFTMGDDGQPDNPKRKQYLPGFWMYKYPVTVAQYRRYCLRERLQMPPPPPWGWNDDDPMVNVTWLDAQTYCAWAGMSLPSERQWEKAARGTDGRNFPWGNVMDQKWFVSSCFATLTRPLPVHRSERTNVSPYGVMDMIGNVSQWCEDDYDGSARYRSRRGGSWNLTDITAFHSAFRLLASPGLRPSNDGGFRCVSNAR